MQAGEHRLRAVGVADLDGVVFFAAVIGAEHLDAGVPGVEQRHAGGRDRVEGGKLGQQRGDGGQGQQRQAEVGGDRQAVRDSDQ